MHSHHLVFLTKKKKYDERSTLLKKGLKKGVEFLWFFFLHNINILEMFAGPRKKKWIYVTWGDNIYKSLFYINL